jgi:hypothetical protein
MAGELPRTGSVVAEFRFDGDRSRGGRLRCTNANRDRSPGPHDSDSGPEATDSTGIEGHLGPSACEPVWARIARCVDADALHPEAKVVLEFPKMLHDVVGKLGQKGVVQVRDVPAAPWWSRGVAIGQVARHQHVSIPANGCDREPLALGEGDVDSEARVHCGLFDPVR